MTTIGCTGHQNITRVTRRQIAADLAQFLTSSRFFELTGLSSLAAGADQLFAFSVLASGGTLHALIPSIGYETTFETEQDQNTYLCLLSLASRKTVMGFDRPNEDAFFAAGREVVDRCQVLIAIWDGKNAIGAGGTADIVDYARIKNVEVHRIWPEGADRG